MKFWLIKSEPDVFSIDDMKKAGREAWDGIRNYQARNFMRDDMEAGDLVLFYHSNAKPPGIAGVVRVSSEAYPDALQFKKGSNYHDPKSDPENPRWMLRDMEFVAKFPNYLPLPDLREDPALEGMILLKKGSRLSIMPVEEEEFRYLCEKGGWKE